MTLGENTARMRDGYWAGTGVLSSSTVKGGSELKFGIICPALVRVSQVELLCCLVERLR